MEKQISGCLESWMEKGIDFKGSGIIFLGVVEICILTMVVVSQVYTTFKAY